VNEVAHMCLCGENNIHTFSVTTLLDTMNRPPLVSISCLRLGAQALFVSVESHSMGLLMRATGKRLLPGQGSHEVHPKMRRNEEGAGAAATSRPLAGSHRPPGHRTKVLSLGSACSGLGTEALCFEHYLRMPFQHVFVCERQRHCQRLLQDTYHCEHYFSDCKDLHIRAPTVDVFVSGPPCQPWSRAGLMLGESDERFCPFVAVVRYIETKRPKLCILENVKDMTCHRNIKVLQSLKARLARWYFVDFKVLNSNRWLPQNRERVYIVCRRRLS
jgi:C-5 cytosine-specific DNA methylase